MLLIDTGLPRDDRASLFECMNLLVYPLTLGIEQRKPLCLVARAVSDEGGEPLELGQRHPDARRRVQIRSHSTSAARYRRRPPESRSIGATSSSASS